MQNKSYQPDPPDKPNTVMKDFGWPVLTVIFTVLATLIGTIVIGKVQIIDFSWVMLVLGCIMLVVTVLLGWYTIRNQHLLRKQYEKDVADLDAKFLAHQIAIRDNVNAMSRQYQGRIDALIKASPVTVNTYLVPPRKPQ